MSENRNAPLIPPAQPPAYPAPTYQAPSYQAPVYQAPAGAYQVPAGGYAPAAIAEPRPKGSPALGLIALALSLVAAVACTIIIGVTGWNIGYRLPGLSVGATVQDLESLSMLSPVRDEVLWAELSLWVGSVTGIAAIVLGIIATVRRHGRGAAIAALVVAAVGPIAYFTVAATAFTMGATAGALATIA